MANAIETFWAAIDQELTDNAEALGVVSVMSGEAGKSASLKTPGLITWLDLESAQFTHVGSAVGLNVKLIVFCVGAGKATGREAISGAIGLALEVAGLLSGTTHAGTLCELADPPFDLVEASANRPAASVSFDCTVKL